MEQFIDTPVKRYSSGMNVRLAFAVAAHLETEILVVDEVLAVGDAEFRKKSLGKMDAIAEHGRTVLFVSHNMASINYLCTRCIILNRGAVVFNGEPDEAVHRYTETSLAKDRGNTAAVSFEPKPELPAQLLAAEIVHAGGDVSGSVSYQEGFEFLLKVIVNRPDPEYYMILVIADTVGNRVLVTTDNDFGPSLLSQLGEGVHGFRVPCPGRLLKPGKYYCDTFVARKGTQLVDKQKRVLEIDIVDNTSWSSSIGGYYQSAVVAPEILWTETAWPFVSADSAPLGMRTVKKITG